ncbi:MAG: hypothetical protein JWL90_1409 [Chthoniobacteraceae bacterium]|nr:hypothetical protein [Chthoniobacteraceae bacterium]
MPAEARITSIWSNQKLLVILLLIGVGGWFLSDGLVGYPRKNARYREWKSYVESGRENEWPAYAAQRGWNPKEWPDYVQEHHLNPLPEDVFGQDKVVVQLGIAIISGLTGLLTLAYWSVQKKRIVRTDEEAVYAPAGQRVPFQAITGIGKKRWDSKGIATVRYELDGRKGEFIIDDYKFDAEPSRQILKEIEEKLQSRDDTAAT